MGSDSIAAAISEETDTVEDVLEPFLMQMGLITRTPRGRVVTPQAYKHLGIPMNRETQKGLEQNSLF